MLDRIPTDSSINMHIYWHMSFCHSSYNWGHNGFEKFGSCDVRRATDNKHLFITEASLRRTSEDQNWNLMPQSHRFNIIQPIVESNLCCTNVWRQSNFVLQSIQGHLISFRTTYEHHSTGYSKTLTYPNSTMLNGVECKCYSQLAWVWGIEWVLRYEKDTSKPTLLSLTCPFIWNLWT